MKHKAMPAVTLEETSHDIEVENKRRVFEAHSSGFTAVNGRPSPPEAMKTDGVVEKYDHKSSRDSSNSQSPHEAQATSSHRDAGDLRQTNGDSESRTTSPDSFHKKSPSSSRGKRKRSTSEDERDRSSNPWGIHVASEDLPRRRVDIDQGSPNPNNPRRRSNEVLDSEHMPPKRRSYSPSSSNMQEDWLPRQQMQTPNSEVHVAVGNQPEPRTQDLQSQKSNDVVSTERPVDMPPMQSEFGGVESTRNGVQADPKKRKRV